MKSDDLNRWLSLGANIGVLIGIFLLVIELGQNREMMRAQIRNEMAQGLAWIATQDVNDADYADLRRRGDNGEELSETERYQYRQYVFTFFRFWENMHYQYRIGLYDEVEFMRQREAWRGALTERPGFVIFWCSHKMTFSLEFGAEIDELLSTYKCN